MGELLFISNISYKINNFSKASISASKRVNLSFHYAANWTGASQEQICKDEREYSINIHSVDIQRSPLSLKNLKALAQVKEIVKRNRIQFIHCNTPVGSIIGRLLSKQVRKVIYEAHGFHFYKGAPIFNWLIYYPIEKLLARRTDAIITINREDYDFASKHLHPKSKVYYVPGVGIELENWKKSHNLREELGFDENDFIILVVGRLEKNKNCGTIIDTVSRIGDERVKLVFCGDGEDREELIKKSGKMGKRVIFLGSRTDMPDIYHMADCFVLASFREGLSRSIMEAMACGLPCIVSDIRGNRDLIDSAGGFLFDPTDSEKLLDSIKRIHDSVELRMSMSMHNQEKIMDYSYEKVVNLLSKIYEEEFDLDYCD